MSKIDLAKLRSGGRHTTTARLVFENGDGTKTTEEMRIVYRGVSLREGQEIENRVDALAESDKRQALIDALCAVVLELPDVEDAGAPVKPDQEFFATLDTYYLNRINQAIQDDRQGKES